SRTSRTRDVPRTPPRRRPHLPAILAPSPDPRPFRPTATACRGRGRDVPFLVLLRPAPPGPPQAPGVFGTSRSGTFAAPHWAFRSPVTLQTVTLPSWKSGSTPPEPCRKRAPSQGPALLCWG